MKAIILAAGRGSRMGNFTDERPKCLASVDSKPLLQWQLDALRAAGLTDIAIVTGYCRDKLPLTGLTEFHNARWAETNMVSSLECAASWLASDECIVSYADLFYTADPIKALISAPPSPIALTYDPDWRKLWEKRFGNPLDDAETFRLHSDRHTLAEIGQKPQRVEDVEGQYMGLLRFSPPGWQAVTALRASLPAAQRDRMHMTGTLQALIESSSVNIQAIASRTRWGEVDTQEDLHIYNS